MVGRSDRDRIELFLLDHLPVINVLLRNHTGLFFDMFSGPLSMFVVDIADRDQLDGLTFLLQFAEVFDMSIETSSSRSDEADPQFGWRRGHRLGFRLKPEDPCCCRGGNRRS